VTLYKCWFEHAPRSIKIVSFSSKFKNKNEKNPSCKETWPCHDEEMVVHFLKTCFSSPRNLKN